MTGGPGAPEASGPFVVLAAGLATRYGGVKPLAPVGLNGEAVIDVLASEAIDAGFRSIVLVVGPETGPAIRYHVQRTWPGGVEVTFATQSAPLGTVDAVLAAVRTIDAGASFAVANADDIPDRAGLELLARHLAGPDPLHALVCYRLGATLVGEDPVTRGICDIGEDGLVRTIAERRRIAPAGGGELVAGDGHDPRVLDPKAPVSVNLWGFRPGIAELLEGAMAGGAPDAEVLLPEVIGTALGADRPSGTPNFGVRGLRAPGRCIGVTHPGDVDLVRSELAREVGRGERAAQLWQATRTLGVAPTPSRTP